MQRLATVVIAMIAFLTIYCEPSPAWSQTAQQLQACRNRTGEPDDRIRACTVFTRTRRAVGGRPAPADGLAAIFSIRGNAYVEKGQLDAAIEDYDEAVRLAANLWFIYEQRAIAFSKIGEFDRAIADMDAAIRLGNADKISKAELYMFRGEFYSAKRELDRAMADFNEAIRLNPKGAFAYQDLGSAYDSLGEHERAKAAYETAARLADPATREKFKNSRELLAHWIAYLKEIQSENDYVNWSGPAWEVYRRSITQPEGQISAPGKASCALAAVHWKSAESIGTLTAYEDHLARFSDCEFATLARARIEALKK